MAPKRKPAESAKAQAEGAAAASAEPLVRKKPGRPVGSKNMPPKFKVALSVQTRPRPAPKPVEAKAGPQDPHAVKRKVGRPPGSGGATLKKRGRPAGSTTKPGKRAALGSADAPKKRGRPVGSTAKPKKRAALGSGDAPKKRGRPVGSKNKA